jgi:ATP-dependent Clp protease adaptor protein ClpS
VLCHHVPVTTASPEVEEVIVPDNAVLVVKPWATVVWDDPINLMSYVTHVFRTYFGYDKRTAEKLMMTVHNEGKASVSAGTREEMERDVEAMHGYGLWATLEQQ